MVVFFVGRAEGCCKVCFCVRNSRPYICLIFSFYPSFFCFRRGKKRARPLISGFTSPRTGAICIQYVYTYPKHERRFKSNVCHIIRVLTRNGCIQKCVLFNYQYTHIYLTHFLFILFSSFQFFFCTDT